jgi:hypothetical protein
MSADAANVELRTPNLAPEASPNSPKLNRNVRFADLIELNFMYSVNQFYALFRQADELGELFVRVIADIAEAAVSHMEEESNGSR